MTSSTFIINVEEVFTFAIISLFSNIYVYPSQWKGQLILDKSYEKIFCNHSYI